MFYQSKRTTLAISVFTLLTSMVALVASESYLATFLVLLCVTFPIYALKRDNDELTLFSLVLPFLVVLTAATYLAYQFSEIFLWFAISLVLFLLGFFQLISIITFLKVYRAKNVKEKLHCQFKNVFHLSLTYVFPLIYLCVYDSSSLLKFVWILIPLFLLSKKQIRQIDTVILFTFGIGTGLAISGLLWVFLAASASVFDPGPNQLHVGLAVPVTLYFGFSFAQHISISWRSFKNIVFRGVSAADNLDIKGIEYK